MSNPHFDIAKFRQGGVHEWQVEEGSTDATNIAAILDAQTQATLALAYEQRTANLLSAFRQVTDADDCPTFLGERIDPIDIAKQIKERLGLR